MGDPTREELARAIEALGPFHHDVELLHGLRTVQGDPSRPIRETRVRNLVGHLWPRLLEAAGGTLEGKSVLDIACCSGGFSVEAARSGTSRVLGIDVVDRYLEQARFIRDTLGLGNLDFRKMHIEDLSPETVGTFDVTFCFGLLYHLENPVLAMRRVSEVTSKVLVVDTDLLPPKVTKKAMWRMNVQGPSSPGDQNETTGLWRTEEIVQFTPSAGAVMRLMQFLGFSRVEHLEPRLKGIEKRYPKGERGTFIGIR
jgi:SAM-dependent methyltransferase